MTVRQVARIDQRDYQIVDYMMSTEQTRRRVKAVATKYDCIWQDAETTPGLFLSSPNALVRILVPVEHAVAFSKETID